MTLQVHAQRPLGLRCKQKKPLLPEEELEEEHELEPPKGLATKVFASTMGLDEAGEEGDLSEPLGACGGLRSRAAAAS